MKLRFMLIAIVVSTIFWSCADKKSGKKETMAHEKSTDFNYNVDQFADVKILRYQIPGWEKLSLCII